jgi:hypothetical protein
LRRWRPPKGMDPGAVEHFSCKLQASGVPQWGREADHGPQQVGLAAPSSERGVVARGHRQTSPFLQGEIIPGGPAGSGSRSRAPRPGQRADAVEKSLDADRLDRLRVRLHLLRRLLPPRPEHDGFDSGGVLHDL